MHRVERIPIRFIHIMMAECSISLQETYYNIGSNEKQERDLETTIKQCKCAVKDDPRLVKIATLFQKAVVRISYIYR